MPAPSTEQSLKWWADDLSDAERGKLAVKAQKLICNLPSEGYRRDRDLFNIRLYENNPVITLYSFAGRYYSEGGAATLTLPPPEVSVDNKAKAAIDTFTSQVFSTDQRARCRSKDASYKQKRRARKLQQFCDGLAYGLKLHKMRIRAGKDACVLESGVGALQFFRDGDNVCVQRVLATELCFDPLDGLVDGTPQTLYRRRPVPRDRVKALWGDDGGPIDEAIDAAATIATGGAPADHIEVFEAWHLPTTKDSEDGWHVIALDVDQEGACLLAEGYTKDHHEIVFYSVEERFTTGWGLSFMTQMRPLQTRINANRYRIERSQKIYHAMHLYVNRAARLQKSALSNEIGSVWEGNGDVPPQQIKFQLASPELYQQIEKDGQLIFQNNGISIGAAHGASDLGANAAAAAYREETKKADDRNSERQQRWEQFHLDCVRVAMGIVRDIAEKTEDGKDRDKPKSFKVAAPGRKNMTVVDWKDVAMDEEDYHLEIKAASPVPTDPDGLVALGERMVELGAWTPQQLAGYYQDLDADGRTNRMMAKERVLEDTFEELLYEDNAAALPDEFTDFNLALELGAEYLDQGIEDGVPEKHLERVRRYLKRCKQMLKASQQPPPGAAPPGQPAGQPPAAAPPPPQPMAAAA